MPACPNCGDDYGDQFACPRCTAFATTPWRPTVTPLIPEVADEKKPPRNAVTLGGCVGLVVVLLAVGFAAWGGWRAYKDGRWRDAPAADDDWREDARAVAGGDPVDAEGMAPELRPVLLAFGAATRRQDGAALAALFDIERYLEAAGAPPRLISDPDFRDRMRRDLGVQLGERPASAGFDAVELRSVRRLPGLEYVVIARSSADGHVWRTRFWLTRRDGGWRLFDMEDLLTVTRMSAMERAAVRAARDGVPLARLQAGDKAIDALRALGRGDKEGARRHLDGIAGTAALPAMEGLRQVAHALLESDEGRFEKALTHIDAAERAHPEMPLAMLARGRALVALGRAEEALKPLEAYHALMGDDQDVCLYLGECHRRLGRGPEAAANFRKSLGFNAKRDGPLWGLLFSLSNDDPGADIAGYLAKQGDPKGFFTRTAPELVQEGMHLSARLLRDAMREIDPKLPELLYHDALGLARGEGPAEKGVELYKEALAAPGDKEARAGWPDAFFKAMLDGERPELAYPLVPGKAEAFRQIAAELHRRRSPALLGLVRLRAARAPDDPLVPLYRGAALLNAGDPDGAAAAFAEGAGAAREVIEPFHADRVRALYLCGRAMEALREVNPAGETFTLLAELMAQDGPEEFAALVSLHGRRFPGARELAPAECLLLAKQGKGGEAIKLVPEALAADTDAGRRRRWVEDFLSEMRRNGMGVEAYLAAPEPRPAFAALWPPEADPGSPWLARLLEEHRRRDPSDPLLPLREAALLGRKRDYAGAAAVLEVAWRRAEGDEREDLAFEAAMALVKARRVARATALIPAEEQVQLAAWIHAARRGPELLLQARALRARHPHAAELMEGRAWLLLGRPDRALASLGRLAQAEEAAAAAEQLAGECAEAGVPPAMCVAALNKDGATAVVGLALIAARRPAEALNLIDQTKTHGTAEGEYLLAVLYQWRGDTRQARWHLARVPRKSPLQRAHLPGWRAVAEGRAAEAALADPSEAAGLAETCVSLKDAAQLRALMVVERRLRPDALRTLAMEAAARTLAGDHAGAVRLLEMGRGLLLRPGRDGLALVRALVSAGRVADAVREAETQDRMRRGTLRGLMLAYAAAGDVEKCLAVLRRPDASTYLATSAYHDRDLGPLLRGEMFAALRAQYPPPKGWR